MQKFLPNLFAIFVCILAPTSLYAQAADEMSQAREREIKFLESIDLTKNHFEHETRIGAILSTGNTRSFSASGNSRTLFRVKRWENKWRLGAYYTRIFSSTNPSVSEGTLARYIFGTYRIDYYFLQNTTVYWGGGGYTDEIKGIELAGNGFTGVSHYLVRTEKTAFRLAGGYDFTYEDRVPPAASEAIHSATQEIYFLRHINDIVSVSQGINAWENLVEGSDFRLNSDTELKVKLNDHLGLVLAYHLRFDNQPVTGFKKLDTITDFSVAITF